MTRIIINFFIFILMAANASALDHFDGEFYMKHSKPQYAWAHDLIKKMDVPLYPFNLLDIGCGDGKITKDMQHLFPQAKVTAIDPNKSMIKLASKQSNTIKWQNSSLGDLSHHHQYDVITSFSTLHWIKNLDGAFKKIFSFLKEGGKAYFVFCSKIELIDRLGHSIKSTTRSNKWKNYFNKTSQFEDLIYLYTPEEISLKLNNANFKIIESKTVETSYIFKSKEDFYQWCYGWSPYKNILKDKHKEFWLDVINAYLTYIPELKDGSINYIDYMQHVIVEKEQTNKNSK
jgi:trans-aconitate 2-methyltransferase